MRQQTHRGGWSSTLPTSGADRIRSLEAIRCRGQIDALATELHRIRVKIATLYADPRPDRRDLGLGKKLEDRGQFVRSELVSLRRTLARLEDR